MPERDTARDIAAASPRRRLLALAAAVAVAASLTACADPPEPAAKKKEPVTVEKIAGTDLSKLILEAQAAERIGVELEPVGALPGAAEGDPERPTVPYGAVLYDAKGATFVYTNTEPLTFVRHPIIVDVIQGPTAMLNAGPPTGTPVVTVGGAELLGIEFGVGK